jgi:hypothetical protein
MKRHQGQLCNKETKRLVSPGWAVASLLCQFARAGGARDLPGQHATLLTCLQQPVARRASSEISLKGLSRAL